MLGVGVKPLNKRSPKNLALLRPLDASGGLPGELVARLTADIVSGKLLPGSRLPTEQEMIAATGVSRTVVREAVAALKADRLVVTRQGVGAFVADHVRRPFRVDFDEHSTLREVLNVMELRTGVEIEAAGLAAERATPTQVKKIADRYAAIQAPSRAAITRSIRTSPSIARSLRPPAIRNSAVSSNISAVSSSRGARSGDARRRRQSENSSICFSMSTRRSSRRSAITPSPRRATPCSGTSSTAAPATRRSPPNWGSSSVTPGGRRPGNAHELFSGNSMSAYRILGPGAQRRRPAWSVAWATAFAFGVQSADISLMPT